jgi:hypothetical protein
MSKRSTPGGDRGAKRGPDHAPLKPPAFTDDAAQGEGIDTERVMSNLLMAIGALQALGNENMAIAGLIDCLEEDVITLRGLIAVSDMHRADLINYLEAHP